MQHFITQYGYLAVFLLMLAESACIPIPSEVIMLFGGALAAGAVPGAHPSLLGIIVAGVLGNLAGSYIAWAVGKYAGQAAVHRWGRRVGIREHDIDRATAWFERHGASAVLFGRVVPVVRTFISLPAGFAGMPAIRFGLFTTLGCIPWTAALAHRGIRAGRELAKRCQRLPRPHLRDRGHHRGRRGGRDCPAPAPEAPQRCRRPRRLVTTKGGPLRAPQEGRGLSELDQGVQVVGGVQRGRPRDQHHGCSRRDQQRAR